MSELKYQQEFLCMADQEVASLAELEWEESGHPFETLCIDWDKYFDLEEQGMLKFFTARDGERLVGYFVVIYAEPFTTKGSPVALYDAVYVDREYRGIGRKLFNFTESCIKQDGIYRAVANSSVKNPIGRFLEKMGYFEVETRYEKAL